MSPPRLLTAQENADLDARLQLKDALRIAVERREFVLHYQPKVEIASGRVVGVEALLRWVRPGIGFARPAAFLPTLESTGLIVDVGGWVIDQACRQLALWISRGRPPITVAVNVSAQQLTDGDLVADVTAALDRHAVPAHLLELELAAGVLTSTDRTIEALRALRALGVRISIDDFGTGQSSLAHLRRFPISTVKIDLAVVRGITVDPSDAATALALIQLAHALRLDVVAEGVETQAQLEYLRRHRCDQAQGYFFSRPLSAVALDVLLGEGVAVYAGPAAGEDQDTVLAFGSDPPSLLALQDLLVRDGYRVLSTTSVMEALELLDRHPVQVVVCEQPDGGEGQRLLDAVQQFHAAVLLVIIGGSDARQVSPGAAYQQAPRLNLEPWEVAALRADVRDAFRSARQGRASDPAA